MKVKNNGFRISNKVIWLSSIFLGMLTAVPKIAEHHFHLYEAIVDSSITCLFALLIWYYNIYTLPAYESQGTAVGFSPKRLFKGLAFGLVLMFVLACVQQYLLAHLPFGPVMLMFEVRGILISVAFYMSVHLFYQSSLNQQVGIALERSKAHHLSAQYELLKQQVNPHFLFNSLNTLKYMVESNDKFAVEFILKLSDFYRFTLESRKLDLITLSEELEILDAYMYLQKARFEDGINLLNEINKEHYTAYLPPFTLQLLIENSIKHNVISIDRPLNIHLYSEGDFLVVSNNLQAKRVAEVSTGIGLENINQRYMHLSGKEVTIDVSEHLFTVKLPIIYEYHNR